MFFSCKIINTIENMFLLPVFAKAKARYLKYVNLNMFFTSCFLQNQRHNLKYFFFFCFFKMQKNNLKCVFLRVYENEKHNIKCGFFFSFFFDKAKAQFKYGFLKF